MIFLNSSSRVEKMLSVKNSSPRVNYLALGEEFFTESFFLRRELFFFTLGEELFAKSPRFGSHQSLLLLATALFP
jgi:hypothetical protein